MTTILALDPTIDRYPTTVTDYITTEMAEYGYTVEWMPQADVSTYRSQMSLTNPDDEIITPADLDDRGSEILASTITEAWDA